MGVRATQSLKLSPAALPPWECANRTTKTLSIARERRTLRSTRHIHGRGGRHGAGASRAPCRDTSSDRTCVCALILSVYIGEGFANLQVKIARGSAPVKTSSAAARPWECVLALSFRPV